MTDTENSGRERFEAVCEGCGLNTIVEWRPDEGKGMCRPCWYRDAEDA